jgi:hypothetical protein
MKLILTIVIILLILHLAGKALVWWAIFSPLIIAVAVSSVLLALVMLWLHDVITHIGESLFGRGKNAD